MKRKLNTLSGRYLSALRKHLSEPADGNLEPARQLGRQAVAKGLETLDVAKLHEQALARLEASCSKDGIIERADGFFKETLAPIEKTHRASRRAFARLSRLNKTLDRRTADLATAQQNLKQGMAGRTAVEAALSKSGKHYKTLLRESLVLQKHLQRLAHQVLSAQEDKRKKISHDLQDEIAQTLLAINVRLLKLKEGAGLKATSLHKEIATTQGVVNMSVKTIERFARDYAKHHEP